MTLEIIKEKFYFGSEGNFQEEKIKKIKDILEFLKNYNISMFFKINFI